jgi:hypothetical protein
MLRLADMDRSPPVIGWQGRHAEAQPMYERALCDWLAGSARGGSADVRAGALFKRKTAADMDRSSPVIGWQGRHAEAQPMYERALSLREKLLHTWIAPLL